MGDVRVIQSCSIGVEYIPLQDLALCRHSCFGPGCEPQSDKIQFLSSHAVFKPAHAKKQKAVVECETQTLDLPSQTQTKAIMTLLPSVRTLKTAC